jgi:hypothetical protein
MLAIAFSAGVYLPGTAPPIFTGQAFAANANSDGNGRSGDDNGRSGGNNGNSGNNGKGGQSSNAPSHASKDLGLLHLLHLLVTGGAKPSSAGTTPAGVATGEPLQLLPPQADGAATGTAVVGLPVPRPVEGNLEPGADSQPAPTANDEANPTYEDDLNAAVAVIEADSSFNATVDAYKALAAIIAAFEEAENRAAQDE